MTSMAAPLCMSCTRRTSGKDWPITCSAYPDGVPDAIWKSEVDHRQPQPGDGGLLFDPVDADATAYAELLFSERSSAAS